MPEMRRPRVRVWAPTTSAKRPCPPPRSPPRAATSRAARSSCSNRCAREQMTKLLATGKTDLLDKFVSMRTRRPFKAFLAWDAEAGKVNFEFEPRTSKFPPRKGAPGRAAAKEPAAQIHARSESREGRRQVRGQEGAGQRRRQRKRQPRPRPRARPAPASQPSAELAAVIGTEPVARTAGRSRSCGTTSRPTACRTPRTSAPSTPTPSCCRCSAKTR